MRFDTKALNVALVATVGTVCWSSSLSSLPVVYGFSSISTGRSSWNIQLQQQQHDIHRPYIASSSSRSRLVLNDTPSSSTTTEEEVTVTAETDDVATVATVVDDDETTTNGASPSSSSSTTPVITTTTTTTGKSTANFIPTPSSVTWGDSSTISERMFDIAAASASAANSGAGGAGAISSRIGFERVSQQWERLKSSTEVKNPNPTTPFVSSDGAVGNPAVWKKLRSIANAKANAVTDKSSSLDYDIVICGGTLGIFFGLYLQLQGHNVCVLEAGSLRGRDQEWNISMDELVELKELGVLTQDDIDVVVTTEFPACRSGFKNEEITPLSGGYFDNDGIGYECLTPDVLNLGVSPTKLIERVSKRFVENGGTIKEETRLAGICVSESVGVGLDVGSGDNKADDNDHDEAIITSRLVLDCMGNASPISAQQRSGMKPDGVCAVVGSCAGGYDKETNLYGDIIYTNMPIVSRDDKGSNQYFWEAFPVGIGRNGQEPGTSDVKTTYMFTYMDASKDRPSLLQLMEDYWRLLPIYQPSIDNVETDLDVKRILFAYFPTFRDSPLQPEFSRVLAVGDASGIQSPLSFGGFGALTRHLARVGGGISEAMEMDVLHKDDLAAINAYQPNLSAAWMFQKAMSVKPGQSPDPKFVNRLLATNFQVMDDMGQRTMRPFLQDVVRFDGLVGSLARSFIADPLFMPQIVGTVGLPELVKWLGHLGNMGLYSLLDTAATPIVEPVVEAFVKDDRQKFQWRRRMEAWKFGSGNDYKFPKDL